MSKKLGSPAILGLVRIFSIVTGLVTAPIVTSSLAPADRGIFGTVVAIFTVLPIVLDFGASSELRRRLATSPEDNESGKLQWVTLPILLIAGILGALVCSVLFWGFDSRIQMAIFSGAITASLGVRLNLIQARLLDSKMYLKIFVIRAAQPLIYLLLIILGFGLSGLNLEFAIWSSIVSNICAYGVAKLVDLPVIKTKSGYFAFLRNSWLFGLGSIGEFALFRGDQVFALPLIGPKETGFYLIATILLTLPSDLLSPAISAAYFHKASRSIEKIKESTEAFGDAMVLGIIPLLGLLTLAPIVIPIVFGRAYAEAISPVFWGLAGSYVLVIFRTMSQLAISINIGLTLMVSCWIGFLSDLLMLYLLRSFGANGAAVASSIGYFVALCLLLQKMPVNLRSKKLRFHSLPEALSNLKRGEPGIGSSYE